MFCYPSKRCATGLPPLPHASNHPAERPPAIPVVCYVTDRRSPALLASGADLLARVRSALAAGVDWVQVREKDLGTRDLLALVRGAAEAARNAGTSRRAEALVIVNDRLDVALAAGAAGVHLGGESLPVSEVARWRRKGNAPADFRIGVSCHSLAEAREAEVAGANYVIFGPVFDTPAKRRFGTPQGAVRLAEVCRATAIPVIAIGGVQEENAAECLRAGAAGIAAIRMFQEVPDLAGLEARVARLHALRMPLSA